MISVHRGTEEHHLWWLHEPGPWLVPVGAHCLLFHADPVCGWTCLCHRAGEDVSLLLPEAQDEGHQFLPGGRVCGPDRVAHCWRCAGGLRILSLVQVRVLCSSRVLIPNLHHHHLCPLSSCVHLPSCLLQGFLPCGCRFYPKSPRPRLSAQPALHQFSEYQRAPGSTRPAPNEAWAPT